MPITEISNMQAWLQTGGLAGVVGILFFFLYRLVMKLIELQKDTTEVIDRNTTTIETANRLGTEHVSELRNMTDEIRSRPCILEKK